MIRVRFAPSPTGYMHLGNIRVALLNYLFARQKNGKFILRIEDTDQKRNIDLGDLKIVQDLDWLMLTYDEGPRIGGLYAPYLQSERTNIYKEKLQELIDASKVYRCFCTDQELEVRRARQIALGYPPRYDRACLGMSDDMIKQELVEGRLFIWRLKLNENAVVEIDTLERNKIKFELKNFGDFALTRSDESFTFMFCNFVDDWLMAITHVIRGEDHLSNTAMQGALYDAFAVPLPKFWHLPILCGQDGKRLSKREFGFALEDLKKAGFLPYAICNYLAVSGSTFKEEIQSLDDLSKNYNFDHIHSTGHIRYDVEKLKWFNHKWMMKLDSHDLIAYVRPLLSEKFSVLDDNKLIYLLDKVKNDVKTLVELEPELAFYVSEPNMEFQDLEQEFGLEASQKALRLVLDRIEDIQQPDYFLNGIKRVAKEMGLDLKVLFGVLRYMLTGKFQGLGIKDLLEILDTEVLVNRINRFK